MSVNRKFTVPEVISTHLAAALPVGQGGTGAQSASAALASLGAVPLLNASPSTATGALFNGSADDSAALTEGNTNIRAAWR